MPALFVTLCLWLAATAAQAQLSVEIGYLTQAVARPPVLSTLDRRPEDLGQAGAMLGIAENNTTGRFTGQEYALTVAEVPEDGDALAAARQLLQGSGLLVLDVPAGTLLAIADLPEAADALLFNASAPDLALRDGACRANLLHTAPSYAMRTDALAQFLVYRRWARLAMIAGTHPDDQAFAASLRGSLRKFGLKLGAEKAWNTEADLRRAAAQEVPLFTQDLAEHDLLLVADEIGDFGRYIAYNSWLPRPVGGSLGLQADAWAPAVEQWGAEQLQGRFLDQSGRPMEALDYAAWAAIRAVGEAVTRTGQSAAKPLRDYMLSEGFGLAGFKGRPMTFRGWNGQMRQPMALFHDDALVALAPLEGFLHQTDELDSLGLDRPDSACNTFQE